VVYSMALFAAEPVGSLPHLVDQNALLTALVTGRSRRDNQE